MKELQSVNVVQKTVVAKICDLCGAREDDTTDWPLPKGTETYGDHDVDVKLVARWAWYANHCDGGGESWSIEIDLCPACIVDRVLPWLKSQGATIPDVRHSDF